MIVKINNAYGGVELFETPNYLISEIKEFHPLICKITVYDNGKKIVSRKRPFSFIHKHFTFKTEKVQNELKKIQESQKSSEVKENEN